MSNIYIQEPPTSGKILLETTVGDVDIELWARETPKASRNFIQLCLEGYYNGTIFHRVIKGFIVQGGDPNGDGTGGESIYGKPFQDELHSRLRFNRRGLVAMCNAGVPHDNGSQFFFTLASCPHLQGKHTIFGKVMGETLFNMLKLEDSLVDRDDKPLYPHKIIKAVVLSNPFPDIVPRTLSETAKKDGDDSGRKKKEKKSRSGVKDFKLLSFGEEAEEDEEEVAEANKLFANKGKSTHDLLSDPKLSSEPAVEESLLKGRGSSEDEHGEESEEGDEIQIPDGKDGLRLEKVRNKLSEAKKRIEDVSSGVVDNQSDGEEEYTLGQDRKKENSKKAEEIREEIRKLKREMMKDKRVREGEKEMAESQPEPNSKTKEELAASGENELVKNYMKDLETFAAKHEKIPPKGGKREAQTMSMLKNFHKRLKMAKEKALEDEEEKNEADEVSDKKEEENDEEDLDGRASDNWLIHKLQDEDGSVPVLAKDANKSKGDEWFDIHDPRNPINQRRREASRQAMQQKKSAGFSKHAQMR